MLFKIEKIYTARDGYTQDQREFLAEYSVCSDLGLVVARKNAKIQTENIDDSIKVTAELHAYSHEQIKKIKQHLTRASLQNGSEYVSDFATMLLKELELL